MQMRKVLIVDDNELNRIILRNILKAEYTVLEAENGRDALDILEKSYDSISAVLLDIVMPIKDGYVVLKEMRERENLAQIPVIVTTGDTGSGTEVKALSLGANDFVLKPYNPEVICQRLRNTINLREKAAIINATRIDPLTGLLNRNAFFELVAEMVSEKEAAGYYVMESVDIDSFKVLNDQYGNEKGDFVLKFIARLFEEEYGKLGGIACRMNADNFAVLYPHEYMESAEVVEIPERAARLDGSILPLTFSIGRYVVDDISLGASAMYDRARIAATAVKGRYDKHIAIYDESMREKLLHEQEISNEMKYALESGEFEVWLQPLYNHATGAMISAEALVRWRHPVKGLISPGVFIPVFEKNGFIYELDKYVWEETCRLLSSWIERGDKPLPISVNISRYDLFRGDLTDVFIELVKKYKIPKNLLRLEVTESAFASSEETMINVVKTLVGVGFIVEIDDFGSGYSSLNLLKDVPAHIVKLDMRFIENKSNTARGGNIVESIIRMTEWLGMSVIAEGVESIRQADYLKSIGCNYIQGFLYARPMPPEMYEKLAKRIKREEKMQILESVDKLDNLAFWDPKSMETLVFNSFVGGASVFEYYKGKTKILRVNEKYTELLFANKEDNEKALKTSFINFVDEDTAAEMNAVMKRAIDTGEEVTHEAMLKGVRDKNSVNYYRSTMRVIARTGERYLFYNMIEDMTAQRLAEKRAVENFEQLQSIMRNVNGGVTVVTLTGGNKVDFIFSNDQYYEQLGYNRRQYKEEVESPFLLVHPDDRERVIRVTKEASERREAYSISYRAMRRDGSIIWLRSNVSLGSFPGIDKPVQIAVANDISSRRNSREITIQMQIVQNAVGGISAATYSNDKYEYIYTNDKYYELFGYTREQFKEENPSGVLSIVHPDDIEELKLALIDEETAGEREYVFRATRRDGKLLTIKSKSSVCTIAGIKEPVHVSILTDISKEKEYIDEIRAAHDKIKELSVRLAELENK